MAKQQQSTEPRLFSKFRQVENSKFSKGNSGKYEEIQGNENHQNERSFLSFPSFSHRSPRAPKNRVYNSPMNAQALDIRKA